MVEFNKIKVLDLHAAGEPARIAIEGVPDIPGSTMAEKKLYCEEHLDHIRTALMFEPRGHNNMFGAILQPPTIEEADFGIIFMDTSGYLNMCGHNTIAMCVAAVEEKMVKVTEPITKVTLETPAGLVKAEVEVENGLAKSVTFTNVPAFLYKSDVSVDLEGVGKVTFDISFGGSFFAIIKATELGVDIDPKNANELIDKGMKLLKTIRKEIPVQHPTLKHIKQVDIIEIFGPPKSPDATMQNVVVFGKNSIDRSPCGTGTSAKMATLWTKGKLKLQEEFVYESILQTKFYGTPLEETMVANYKAIIPQIKGMAYITGRNEYVFDERDPLRYGFLLG